MLVRCVSTFLDFETGVLRNEGEEFEATPERLSVINSTKYGQLAEKVEETPSEAATVPERPKRRGRRPKLVQE